MATMYSEGRSRGAEGGATAESPAPPPPPPPPISDPIIHPGAEPVPRRQPLAESGALLHVLGSIPHAVHPLVQIPRQRGGIARDGFPADVELVVAVVEALRVRRVRAPRLD